MIDTIIYSILQDDATLTTLVGNRIWPNNVPANLATQEASLVPYIVVKRYGNEKPRSLSQTIKRQIGLFRIEYTAKSWGDLQEIGNAVTDALDEVTSSSEGVTFVIFHEGEEEINESQEAGQFFKEYQNFKIISESSV